MDITDEQWNALRARIHDAKDIKDLLGSGGALTQFLGTAINTLLDAERDEHLGYPPHATTGHHTGNSRNGYSKKTIRSSHGPVELNIPRDRNGTFEPTVVPKYTRTLQEIEDKILALYARGMSTRDISSNLEELYGTEISPTLISQITDRVLPQLVEWQHRALDPCYAIVYLDAIHMKIRREGRVQVTAIYTCLGISLHGEKQLLGLWVGDREGAKFWQGVLTDLTNRGVKDILIACVDGLTGFAEAIASVFPRTAVQQCVIHAIRRALTYIPAKRRAAFMADLKPVYTAATEQEGAAALTALEETWKGSYPHAVDTWANNWKDLSTFFDYPACIRTLIYTTNAVEAVHRQMRKVTKTKGPFPSEEAVLKLLYLNVRYIEQRWTHVVHSWPEVLNYLMVRHHDRIKPFLH